MVRQFEHSLPLGIDIGMTRLRIVCTTVSDHGPCVAAVATRNLAAGTASSGAIFDTDYLCGLIEEAWAELATRERRCVLGVGMPDAQLHRVKFPPTKSVERYRLARCEAQRHIDYPVEEAIVRLHPLDRDQDALGIVRAQTLRSRLAALERTSLRAVAVDHEALALQRSLPEYGLILDIGLERTSLHAFNRPIPVTLLIRHGGAAISHDIERELAIDPRSAEKRKLVHGTNGAGEVARDRLIAEIFALVQTLDPRGDHLEPVALVGNGARLCNLTSDLERACGRRVDLATSRILSGEAYPPDVFFGAAPDWNLAAGLSLWSAKAA